MGICCEGWGFGAGESACGRDCFTGLLGGWNFLLVMVFPRTSLSVFMQVIGPSVVHLRQYGKENSTLLSGDKFTTPSHVESREGKLMRIWYFAMYFCSAVFVLGGEKEIDKKLYSPLITY